MEIAVLLSRPPTGYKIGAANAVVILKQNREISIMKPTHRVDFSLLGYCPFSRQKGNPLKLEGYRFLSLGAKTDNPLKVDQLLFPLSLFSCFYFKKKNLHFSFSPVCISELV